MDVKPVRRRVLIRELDYNKMIHRHGNYGGIVFDGMLLYNTTQFEPVSRDSIEKEIVWTELQGQRRHWQYFDRGIRQIFHGMKDYLYNPKYAAWRVFWDEHGYLCVQARSNTPSSRIGWGVFEYTPYL